MTASVRLGGLPGWVLAAVLVALWAALTYAAHRGTWGADVAGLYFAAQAFGAGIADQVYAAGPDFVGYTPPPAWAEAAAALGHADAAIPPYLYPPLWVALAAPLTSLPPQGFFDAMLAANVAALAFAILLALRLAPAIAPPLHAAVLAVLLTTSLAAALALELNQPQMIVAALVTASIERYRARAAIASGVLLALAAAIKLSPALLALGFLATGDRRALLAFALTAAALAAASLGLAGIDLHRQWLARIAEIDAAILISSVNHSTEAMLWLLAEAVSGGAPDIPLSHRVVAQPGWIATAVPGLLAAMVLAALAGTRRLPRADRFLALALLLSIAGQLTAPLGWAHYALLPILLLPTIAARLPPRGAIRTVAVFGLLFSRALFDLAFEAVPDPARLTTALGTLTLFALFVFVLATGRYAAPP